MNPQFSPDIQKAYTRQSHQNILNEAANTRLLKTRPARFARFSIFTRLIQHREELARKIWREQPRVASLAIIVLGTVALAVQAAFLVLF